MISGIAASIDVPNEVHHMWIRPRLNSFTQLYTVADADVLNIIQLGFRH